MPEDLKQLREKFINDRYATEGLGAVIEEAHDGYSRCSMEVRPCHCNALGIPMGGAVFTLADFAFAVATNQDGRAVVTQSSQVNFLQPAKGKRIIAEANQVKDGKRTCFYEVRVTDNLGTLVAFMTVNGYVISR